MNTIGEEQGPIFDCELHGTQVSNQRIVK